MKDSLDWFVESMKRKLLQCVVMRPVGRLEQTVEQEREDTLESTHILLRSSLASHPHSHNIAATLISNRNWTMVGQ